MTKRRVLLTLPLLVLALTAACGTSSAHSSLAAPTVSSSPSPSPTPVRITPNPGPSFATPEAAMRYLASAWNRGDLVELKHVTDPNARAELISMHRQATNLKLDHCTRNEGGDYQCFFTHDYPVGYTGPTTHGAAEFRVGPARRNGWYMTVYESCG